MPTVTIDQEYFSDLFTFVSSKAYSDACGKMTYEKLYFDENDPNQIKKVILDQLSCNGYCLIHFKMDMSFDWLTNWQESFLGDIMMDKNPNNLPYSRIAIRDGSNFFC